MTLVAELAAGGSERGAWEHPAVAHWRDTRDRRQLSARPPLYLWEVDVSTWEERMSRRHAERQERLAAAERARREAIDRQHPRVDARESMVQTNGPHAGHRTHMDGWHGSGVVCSCGVTLGVTCVVIDFSDPPPQPCPICVAYGVLDPEQVMAAYRAECPDVFSPTPPADEDDVCRRCFTYQPVPGDDPRWQRYYWARWCDPESCGCQHHGSGVWYDDVSTAV